MSSEIQKKFKDITEINSPEVSASFFRTHYRKNETSVSKDIKNVMKKDFKSLYECLDNQKQFIVSQMINLLLPEFKKNQNLGKYLKEIMEQYEETLNFGTDTTNLKINSIYLGHLIESYITCLNTRQPNYERFKDFNMEPSDISHQIGIILESNKIIENESPNKKTSNSEVIKELIEEIFFLDEDLLKNGNGTLKFIDWEFVFDLASKRNIESQEEFNNFINDSIESTCKNCSVKSICDKANNINRDGITINEIQKYRQHSVILNAEEFATNLCEILDYDNIDDLLIEKLYFPIVDFSLIEKNFLKLTSINKNVILHLINYLLYPDSAFPNSQNQAN